MLSSGSSKSTARLSANSIAIGVTAGSIANDIVCGASPPSAAICLLRSATFSASRSSEESGNIFRPRRSVAIA